jgi:excisionase family DNA binding protein
MDDSDHFREASQTAHSSGESVPRRYLSYQELSGMAGLSVSTLRRLVKNGQLPFFQPGGPGTRIVFAADVLERLIQPTPRSAQESQKAFARTKAGTPPGPQPKWMRSPKE